MAEILGIVAGFLGPAIELGKCIAKPIKRQFNYLCCFKINVLNLENEAKKLEEVRYGLQSKVNAAQNNAEVVVPRVQTWLEYVSEIQTKMPEIDNEITTARNGSCIVGSRFSLSKKVKNMAEALKELRESGNFNIVSHPPPPAAMASIRLRSIIEFDSRKRVEDEIMASLTDEKTNMVGICGMGGVGKTTMAKTIMHRARKELGFEETVMAVVSQHLDMLKLQDDIAKSLGLTLREGSFSSKAHDLCTRLSAGTRRSLIVIDDVWEKLELEELGIPCNSRCKVLITSRNSHILESMDVEKLHVVRVLSETEAWELFKSKTGSCIEQQNVDVVARQVVDECKGLPLAIVTVGVALKDKANIHCWNTVLCQLKSSNPRHMPEVIKSVYQPLRLSYDMLETDEQTTLFLLCCLFPEDGDIPLNNLAIYCLGLHTFEDITSLGQARDTTGFLVDRLKSRFLLLEGGDENHVKIQDVVRDVSIYIASEEKLIKCNGCTWISPYIGERIRRSTLSPNLRLLWIDRESRDKELEIHDGFFEGMNELNVFFIKCKILQCLPQTIGLLKCLRTLVLESCDSLESISVVGELVNLKILICRGCLTIESLPVEIGRLSCLRLLELSYCRNLKRIAAGIISKLIELEELIIDNFDGWEARNVKGERKNAPLCELEHLSSLTLLKIKVSNCGLAAEPLRLSSNMLKFHISVGDVSGFFYTEKYESTMRLVLARDISLGKWIDECVRCVESMTLEGDGSNVLDLRLALNLRRLIFRNCSTVKKLVSHCPLLEHLWLEEVSVLEEICDIQHNLASKFSKLASITIIGCGRLRNLFSLSMMESGCFLQLERLEIFDCELIEQVVLWNEVEPNQTNMYIPLVFPTLKFIKLDSLPSLTSFIQGIEDIEFPKLGEISIVNCPLLEGFVCSGSSNDHRVNDNDDPIHFSCKPHKVKIGELSKLEVVMGRNLCFQTPIDSFTGLLDLRVDGLIGLKSLFSLSMSSCLFQLEKLEIGHCEMMEQVILLDKEENKPDIHMITPFPKLKLLRLDSLPKLTSLSKGIESIRFPVPAQMHIFNCPLLESCASTNDHSVHLFCKPPKVEFDCLKEVKMYVDDEKMRRNWCHQIPMIDLFSGLCKLDVLGLKGMESLFPCSIARMMPNISFLGIGWCGEMVRVIEDEVDAYGGKTPSETESSPPVLLFPKLERLYLTALPKLRRFCEWRYALQLPLLLDLRVTKCDTMEELTSGPLHTPNLKTFKIDDHDFNGRDVSSALQLNKIRKEEDASTIKTEDEIEEFEVESDCRLGELKIHGCDEKMVSSNSDD